MTNSRNRFSALDGWRAIAALMIALHRIALDGYHSKLPFVNNSYLFVDFFFVLSGFVITHAYFMNVTDTNSLLNFVIRRFGRLWPLHVALLGAFVAIEILRYHYLKPGESAADLLTRDQVLSIGSHALLLQALGFTPEYAARWNVPSWSISVEFWTYVLFGAMCLAFRRSFFAWSCVLIVGSLLLIGARSPSNMNTAFDYGFARCLAGFFMGHICYRIWTTWGENLKAYMDYIGSTTAEVMVVLLAIVFVSVAGITTLSLFAPLFFAPLIIVFAFERGSLSRRMQHPLSVELGALSYSIYMVALLVVMIIIEVAKQADAHLDLDLVQQKLIDGNSRAWLDLGSALANDAFAILYLVIILIVSKITYTIIEAPGRRFFNSVAARVTAQTGATVPAAN
ncbi:MAG: acyltransferase [Hyphomicrobium sp.]|nr:acyltransferase [Hyphomicrobium sp.]